MTNKLNHFRVGQIFECQEDLGCQFKRFEVYAIGKLGIYFGPPTHSHRADHARYMNLTVEHRYPKIKVEL